jgi:hypothetical protein
MPHAQVCPIGQYDLSKPFHPLNEGNVFSTQNDPYSLESVCVGGCRGLGDGLITQRCEAFVTAKAAAKTGSQKHSTDLSRWLGQELGDCGNMVAGCCYSIFSHCGDFGQNRDGNFWGCFAADG